MECAARTRPAQGSTRRYTAAQRCAALLSTAWLGIAAPALAQPADPIPEPAGDQPLFSLDSPIGSIEYIPGGGLHFGRTGFSIGGFTTVEIDREEGEPASIALDGVNLLFLLEPIDWLRVFAELEIDDLLVFETNRDDVHSDAGLVVERLYGDLGYSDALNLRFGKFQTPVGRWNLVPAEPFVWTPEEPVLIERGIDEHTTGAALFGSLYPGSNTLGYWLWGQMIDPLDPDRDSEYAERNAGGRLEFEGPLGNWSLGTSFVASERNGDWNYLGGLDAQLVFGPLELTSEFAIADGDIPDRDLWGVYLQGVYGLGDTARCLRGLYLVARYEHFDPTGSLEDANLWDLGIAWMPVSFLNIKVGYRLSDRETEDVSRGLLSSISVLF